MGAHFKHAIVLTVALTIGSLAIGFGVIGSLNAVPPATHLLNAIFWVE